MINHLPLYRNLILSAILLLSALPLKLLAQDPILPAANLGLANMTDGITPGAGIYYANFTQLYQAHSLKDGLGHTVPTDLKINNYFTIHQIVYLSNKKVFGGLLGATVFIPVVRISATNNTGPVPTINNGFLGDIIIAPAIVWGNRKLFGKPLFHRAELDFFLPTGSYNPKYDINPGSHHYTISAHYTFTYFLSPGFSISARNHLNYNTKIIGSNVLPGMFYNVNFSLEQTIYKTFRAEICGYYLKQLNQDSNNGDSHYYQDNFGITNTKERVLGIGPGLSYLANQRLVMEGKVFFETAAQNREQGIRPALQLSYKF
nr:transporter [Mucilaginibacter sp. L294]